MITLRGLAKTLVVAALIGAALYAAVYLMARHSDAFAFVQQRIRSSQAIKAQVGEIEEVRPSPFGSYDRKTVGSDEWVSMTVDVTGAARSIEVDVKAKKSNGVWTLESIKRGGQAFDAN